MNKQEIVCADCVPWMRGQPPNSIDAIVTDPPYGIDSNEDYCKIAKERLAGWRIDNDQH
jgi:tRNA G10  N-methylase Trm11